MSDGEPDGPSRQEVSVGPGRWLSREQSFERAATLHRRGRVGEAESLYRAVLNLDPDHVGALHNLGIIAGQQGRALEAERLMRRALTLQPGSQQLHNNLGMALAALGRLEDACGEYQKAVALDPGYVEARNNLGNGLQMLGRASRAVVEFEAAVAARPDMAELHNNLGNSLRGVGREPEAIASFRRALAIRPDFAEAHNNLGVALTAVGKPEDAIAFYQRAIALRPSYFEAHNNFGNALAALGRHDEAVAEFEKSIAINPGAAGTHNNFGNLLATLKRHEDAGSHYRTAIELQPGFFEAHNNLGNALAASGRLADAMLHFQKAIEINPDYADAHSNLGNVFGGLERYDEALVCFRKALAIDSRMAETWYCLGNVLITLGRIGEGRQAFEAAIALAPGRPEFYRSLGECKRFAADDPHLAAIETLARNLAALTMDERVVLHFVLAKAYDDLERYEDASRHLREGNGIRRTQIDYDEASTLSVHTRAASVFTAETIETRAGCGDPSPLPVFVLGMPRSGTTLIEQVLSSHPAVFGAGEILAFNTAVRQVAGSEVAMMRFPSDLAGMLEPEQLRGIGQNYVRQIAALAPQADRIVDKALGNFVFAGLIRLALPNARIIHARRNALDTCFSCYSKLFAGELLYTYDLRELGRYYRSYDSLIQHWRAVLGDDAMLEVRYEHLVADFETEARKIVEFAGLQWDDRCLAFHKTERAVRTASATQVRRPVYQSSVGRWRPYEAMLQPLLEELGSSAPSPD